MITILMTPTNRPWESPLTLHIDPGNAPVELLTEYFLTMNELWHALGGDGDLRVNIENEYQLN